MYLLSIFYVMKPIVALGVQRWHQEKIYVLWGLIVWGKKGGQREMRGSLCLLWSLPKPSLCSFPPWKLVRTYKQGCKLHCISSLTSIFPFSRPMVIFLEGRKEGRCVSRYRRILFSGSSGFSWNFSDIFISSIFCDVLTCTLVIVCRKSLLKNFHYPVTAVES